MTGNVTRMTEVQRMQVAIESAVSLKTVRRWDKGGKVNPSTDKAIKDALVRLGIAPPEVDAKGRANG